MNESSPQFSRPLVLGISGAPTGVMVWDGPGQLRHRSEARERFSVYSVSLSPSGGIIAAGTKSPGDGAGRVRGNLEVCNLAQPEDGPGSRGYFALPAAVVSVDWVAEDTLVAASMERFGPGFRGACYFFRVGPGHALERLDPVRPDAFRHDNQILLVKYLGNEKLLTLCNQGIIRIWDLNSGQIEAELPGGTMGQGLPLLPGAVVLPDGNRVLIQLFSGEIRLIKREQSWSLDTLPGFPGPCGGFCCLGDTLLVSPWGNPVASKLRLEDWQKAGEARFDRPYRTLQPLDPDHVGVLHLDGSASVWNLSPEPRCLENLTQATVRGLGGGMSPGHLSQVLGELREQEDHSRLAALQATFSEAADLEDIRRRMEAVQREGQGFEGMVLLADWCRRQRKPLAELRVRTALCSELPEVPESALHFQIYGELLAAVGEKDRALSALDQARICDPQLKGITEATARIQALPDLIEKEDILYLVTSSQGNPTGNVERVREHVLRDFAVGRNRPRSYMVEWKTENSLGHFQANSLDLNEVVKRLQSRLSGSLQVATTNLIEDQTGKELSMEFICYKPASRRGSSDRVELWCELHRNGNSWEYGVFAALPFSDSHEGEMGPDPILGAWSALGEALANDGSPLSKKREAFEGDLREIVGRLLFSAATTSEPDVAKKGKPSAKRSKPSRKKAPSKPSKKLGPVAKKPLPEPDDEEADDFL